MKSYFAKLADRATLANVPAVSAVYAPRVSDPFESDSPQQIQRPPEQNSQRVQPAPDAPGVVVSSPLEDAQTDRMRPVVETQRHTSELPTEVQTLQPKPTADLQVSERGIKEESSVESPRSETPKEDATRETEAPNGLTLVPREAPELSELAAKESPTEAHSETTDKRIGDLEREQAVLLRKADVFMSNLLDARREPTPKNEINDNEDVSTPISTIEREPVNRLAPVQRMPPTTQESEGPSLVIGKLTVEVTPSTSTSAVAPPQRTIVRGSRSRGFGAHSSRRFGLGQF